MHDAVELIDVERFAQHGERHASQIVGDLVGAIGGAEDQPRGRLEAVQVPADTEPVETGHDMVDDRGVETIRRRPSDRLDPITKHLHVTAEVFEHVARDRSDEVIVVDDEELKWRAEVHRTPR